MIVYIDNEYKCHVTNDGTLTAIETPFFDGKCPAYVEGYRFVPAGEVWTHSDGMEFKGAMISPWKDYNVLKAYQEQYEAMLSERQDMQTALETLGVNANG